MRWRAVAGVALRQFYLLRRSPVRLVPMFVWVAMDIVLWGFMARYLDSLGGHGGFVPRLLGAVLFWDLFTRIMNGVTVAFLEDVWARNFLNLFATRILISEYVMGLVLTSLATSLAGVAVMIALAVGAFGLRLLAFAPIVLPLVMILFLFGIAVGILASALVLRYGPASEWIVWPIPAMLAPFAGVFYPISTLPAWMHPFAAALPPSYVFEALRAVVAGTVPATATLVLPASLALAQTALATLAFMGVFRHVVRSGLLARYSAEASG